MRHLGGEGRAPRECQEPAGRAEPHGDITIANITITLIADGSDEKEAVAALAELINSNFGE